MNFFCELASFVDTNDILTKKGMLKTKGSKYVYMKDLLDGIKAETYSWRKIRTARQQAIDVISRNPKLWKFAIKIDHPAETSSLQEPANVRERMR